MSVTLHYHLCNLSPPNSMKDSKVKQRAHWQQGERDHNGLTGSRASGTTTLPGGAGNSQTALQTDK
jgi:hypothetical protein